MKMPILTLQAYKWWGWEEGREERGRGGGGDGWRDGCMDRWTISISYLLSARFNAWHFTHIISFNCHNTVYGRGHYYPTLNLMLREVKLFACDNTAGKLYLNAGSLTQNALAQSLNKCPFMLKKENLSLYRLCSAQENCNLFSTLVSQFAC